MPKRAEEGKDERRLYEPVKTSLSEALKTKFGEFHLEITADKSFSNKLKAQVGSHRDIIFVFLKRRHRISLVLSKRNIQSVLL